MKTNTLSIKLILFTCFIFICSQLIAQQGNVVVHYNPRLVTLEKLQKSIIDSASAEWQNVYRIVIGTTQNRNEAYRLKSKILDNYPQQAIFLSYQSPYFKIKIGNFLSIPEAEQFMKNLPKKLRQTSFIVPDKQLLHAKM
jgi:hypothetical protein